jgi:hypothetical protein
MSWKFAVLGELVSLHPLGAATRADDRTQLLGPARSREPIVISLGWWTGVAPRETPATGALRLFLLNGRIFLRKLRTRLTPAPASAARK